MFRVKFTELVLLSDVQVRHVFLLFVFLVNSVQ